MTPNNRRVSDRPSATKAEPADAEYEYTWW